MWIILVKRNINIKCKVFATGKCSVVSEDILRSDGDTATKLPTLIRELPMQMLKLLRLQSIYSIFGISNFLLSYQIVRLFRLRCCCMSMSWHMYCQRNHESNRVLILQCSHSIEILRGYITFWRSLYKKRCFHGEISSIVQKTAIIKIYRFERFKRIFQSVLSKTLCVKCVKEQPYTFWMVGGSRRTQWSADF